MDGFFSSTREDFDPSEAAALRKGTAPADLADEHGDDGVSMLSEKQQFQFTRELLSSPFYRSVFSGHHVAINCLGTHNLFIASDVMRVDKQYAVAFAKLVRAFSSRDPLGEDRLTRPIGTRCMEVNSEVWREVQAACYGKAGPPQELTGTGEGGSSPSFFPASSPQSPVADTFPSPSAGAFGSTTATLRHFVQLSTAGASEHSPIPYFSAHGEADSTLLDIFCRTGHQQTSPDIKCDTDDSGEGGKARERRGVFCDNSRVTIWRPGLMYRTGSARLPERLLSLIAPGVCAQQLAGLILSDVMSSLDDERAAHETGPTRIIGASSISVWARMAARQSRRS